MEDRETARMRKYGESKTTRIMMATVSRVTSGLGLRKFQADGFLLTRVYTKLWNLTKEKVRFVVRVSVKLRDETRRRHAVWLAGTNCVVLLPNVLWLDKRGVTKIVTQILFRVSNGKSNSKCNRNLWPNGCTVAAREYQVVIRITSAVKNLQLLRSAVDVQLVGKVCNGWQVSV